MLDRVGFTPITERLSARPVFEVLVFDTLAIGANASIVMDVSLPKGHLVGACMVCLPIRRSYWQDNSPFGRLAVALG